VIHDKVLSLNIKQIGQWSYILETNVFIGFLVLYSLFFFFYTRTIRFCYNKWNFSLLSLKHYYFVPSRLYLELNSILFETNFLNLLNLTSESRNLPVSCLETYNTLVIITFKEYV
jgi:hypothetical protein